MSELTDASPVALTLEGDWRTERQYVELRKGTGKIVLPFTAGEVNLVMQPGPSGSAAVTVLLDGKPVGDARGADVGVRRSGAIRSVRHDSPGRRCGAPTARADTGHERSWRACVCVHVRSVAVRRPAVTGTTVAITEGDSRK